MKLFENEMDGGVVGEILVGFAQAAWADAWANHVEETECQSLSGAEITDVMPDVEPNADYVARVFLADFRRANDMVELAEVAKRMGAESDPQDFGFSLYMEAVGHGVGWGDKPGREHIQDCYTLPYVHADVLNCDVVVACGCDHG